MAMTGATKAGTPEAGLVRVARSEELRAGAPHAASAGGVDLVLVRTAAGPRAFAGHCPHQGALLGEGELDGETLICRNHRWRFSVETGRRDGGPQCLASCPIFERDGEIHVDPTPLARPENRTVGKRTQRDLPGPRGLPLLGNTLQLDLRAIHLVLERWAAEYGPIYRFAMGPKTVVTIADPELAEQALRARPETYRRLSNVEPVFEEMGIAGVFSAEGAAWRPQRRLAMEALSHRHLRGFYPTLRTVAARLRNRWGAAAERGEELDIVDDLKRFTVDVTTLLAFGHDVNTLEQSDDVIQRQLELVFPALNRRLFALLPTWRFLRMPQDRRLDRALARLRQWLGDLVAKARAQMVADPARAERPENFLDAMLAARDDAGHPFSDAVIFGNLLTMLLAGEDTTAYTLGWAVHHLCDSPPAVAALRAEADAILGADDVPTDIETAGRLAFAGAVANESMRLRPVAPLLFLEANVDTVLGDLSLPKGSRLAVLTRPPAVDASHFADPGAFRPERWLEGAAGAHEAAASMPFGSGPRICPGRSLALHEMRVVLSTLYKAFDVERVGQSEEVGEVFSFTMSPVGLRVRLRRRS